jgi:hypothetical protein
VGRINNHVEHDGQKDAVCDRAGEPDEPVGDKID